ncbi:MAG: Hsp70 family protein [Bacillota bacterium]|nr:Hsp70 family protein [Bacillota bacterium]
MGAIIGIDLGTTTSEISYLKDGKPEIIKNKDGKKLTFSVVGTGRSGEILVGNNAKKQLVLRPENTIAEVKRLMGKNTKITIGNQSYLPQEISAIILKYLKECAEEYLQEEVTEAVITVPAKFNNIQRQATKDAAAIAGLKAERIINEPTAAALAYGIENYNNEETILVYDLGGGTFDVTILEMFEGVIDVKSSRGNNQLGGKDFDERIMDYLFSMIHEQYGINLKKDLKAVAAVKEAAENAKIKLSQCESVTIDIPHIAPYENGFLFNPTVELTRQQYEILISNLVTAADKIVNEALKAAGLTADDIDTVIPVGGSTRNVCIQKYLENKFQGKIKSGINPDEAVALGAAVQAGIKSGKLNKDSDILITDVCPYSLGISVVQQLPNNKLIDGIFSSIIDIDTTIPVTVSKYYTTAVNNQTKLTISIYQGEEVLAINNKKIGELKLDNIPKAPAGQERILVEFSYDINGILNVKAIVESTNEEITAIITTKSTINTD